MVSVCVCIYVYTCVASVYGECMCVYICVYVCGECVW